MARGRVCTVDSDVPRRGEWKRNSDGRIGVPVGDGVEHDVCVGEPADGQGGCDARTELWGGVAGVGEEGTLSLGPRHILNLMTTP